MHFTRALARRLRSRRFSGSRDYWEQRYASGGDSGAGSYGATAEYKAEILNAYVARQGICTVVELGCGDGHQLSLAKYPHYLGLDVAPSAIKSCTSAFSGDDSKEFRLYQPGHLWADGSVAELALSLDVLLHLIEDEVYDTYMRDLFASASRFVVIFSPNLDRSPGPAHVRYREFLPWVEEHAPDWTLTETVANPHKGEDSVADFWFFERSA